jgi:hypothetical protein
MHQGLYLLPADSLMADAGHGLQEASMDEPINRRLRNPEDGGGFGDGIGE